MVNILNEEISAIKHTIAHLEKGVVLEPDPSKKMKMKKDIKELQSLLESKLESCNDLQG